MEKIKLTKKALNDFITWSTSRYNNYCGYGTKKENVDIVFASLTNGCYTGWKGKKDEAKTIFTIECAGGVGENGNGRHWRLKGRKRGTDYSWEINCLTGTITGLQSQTTISFVLPVRQEILNSKTLGELTTEAQAITPIINAVNPLVSNSAKGQNLFEALMDADLGRE